MRSCALKLSAAPAFRVEYAVREGRGDGVPPVVALHENQFAKLDMP